MTEGIRARDPEDGVKVLEFDSWRAFVEHMMGERTLYAGYVYRGQRDSDWDIWSTYDRLDDSGAVQFRLDRHLHHFRSAVRARRSPGERPPRTENDWWALGRHYGLATPLTDWTCSPFVALYFAYFESDFTADRRAVCALQGASVEERVRELLERQEIARADAVELFTSESDENLRMISQSGVFVKLPEGRDLESWIRQYFAGSEAEILIKYLLPNTEREECLRGLNRMNINHMTLFPDLAGAAAYCNLAQLIPAYIAGGYIKPTEQAD